MRRSGTATIIETWRSTSRARQSYINSDSWRRGSRQFLPFVADSLILNRFIQTMNDHHQSLTSEQYDKVKREVFALYEDNVDRYGGGSSRKLQMSRISLGWSETNTGELEPFLYEVTPKE